MKKNNVMRIASLLLVLTLISACAISGTFAKYVTTGSATDEARVAKFGVNVVATNDSGFDKFYKDTALDSDDGTATVVASENVVAPGTNGTIADITLTGTPEVDVKVDYSATVKLTGWTVDSADYCPLIITVENTKYYIGATVGEKTISSVSDLEDAVEAAIAAESVAKYDAGTDLSTVDEADAPSISWAWEFEKQTVTSQSNENDTKLGDAASAKIEVSVTVTVTQID